MNNLIISNYSLLILLIASFAPYCTKELSSSNNSSSFGRASSAFKAPKIQQAAPLTLHLGLSNSAITGSIAWVYYSREYNFPIDFKWLDKVNAIIPEEFFEIMDEFEKISVARHDLYK